MESLYLPCLKSTVSMLGNGRVVNPRYREVTGFFPGLLLTEKFKIRSFMSEQSWWLTQLSMLLCCPVNGTQRSAREFFWLKHRWSAMIADVITKTNNSRYKEEKKRNRRVSHPRVSTINGNQINGHVLVSLNTRKRQEHQPGSFTPDYQISKEKVEKQKLIDSLKFGSYIHKMCYSLNFLEL